MKMVMRMKKYIVFILAFLLLCISINVQAEDTVSYSENFESELTWAALKNAGTNSDGTPFDGASVKTVAYGSDEDNLALKIESGASCWTHYGEFNTWNKGISPTNSINGKSSLVFDFMPASDTLTQLETCYVTFVKEDGTTTLPNGKGSDRLLTFMKNNNNGYGLRVLNSDTQWGVDYIGDVETHKWHRIQMIFNPEEGTADYILTTNIDGNGESSVYEIRDANLGISGCKGISNLRFFPYLHNGRIYLDNIELFNYTDLKLMSSLPQKGSENVLPVNPISVTFNNELRDFALSLNGVETDQNLWKKSEGNTYTYSPAEPLRWNTEYILTGTSTDIYGTSCDIEIPFKTAVLPDSLVEICGFFGSDGNQLESITSGNVTAKLRFWQAMEREYTYIAVLSRTNDGASEMLGGCAGYIKTADNMKEAEISLNVPEDYADCSISLYFWDNLQNREPYSKSLITGMRSLKGSDVQ